MKRKAYFMVVFCVVLLGVLIPQVIAVSVSTSDVPTTIDQNQEQQITVILECTNCSSDSYIRAVFYPAGSSSYFGYTQSTDGSWINAPGGSCTKYFSITSDMLKEGSWSGVLKIKPDSASSYYKGPGEYVFKVGRYTGSCNSPVWSSEKTIAITGPMHTPSQIPTAIATATPVPTNTPTVMPTLVATSTIIKLTPTIHPTVIAVKEPDDDTDSASSTAVLGDVSSMEAPQGQAYVSTSSSRFSTKPIIASLLMIAAGFGLLSGVFAWKKHMDFSKNEE